VAALICGSGCKSPEEKLAANAEEIAEIMDEHKDSPADGVKALREYLQENLPDMAENVAQLWVDLDSAESTSERHERLDEIMETLTDGAEKLTKAGAAFGKAAMKDEGAAEEMEAIVEQYAIFRDLEALVEGGGEVESRSSKCDRAIDHMVEIMKGEGAHADVIEKMSTGSEREHMLSQCKKEDPKNIDCMLKAETMEEVSKCH